MIYNFLHDENEEDLIFIRMLLARRPWEAPSNQVTNTWQSFTEAMRGQKDSKGNFPFKNIALKTLRSRFTAYLGLEQYWAEKVDPDDSDDEGDQPRLPSNEIRNGINDLFEMIRNYNGSKMAAKDEQKAKEWTERGQVDEMKARALLHLDSAFDGVVSSTKTSILSRLSDEDQIQRDETGGASTDDGTSHTGTPTDTQNPTVTPSRRQGSSSARKGSPSLFELEKIQKNYQQMKEKREQNRLEIQREREKRKLQEAETAKMEQENTRLRLEMQNSQFQANITMQQQMMQQQQNLQQQMIDFITRLTNSKDRSPDEKAKTNHEY